ncbi:hypothetical protein C0991_012417 [Blastosporella zonata]|nr:hypothetical protein C0991_012417 [Blastosporella zonata]
MIFAGCRNGSIIRFDKRLGKRGQRLYTDRFLTQQRTSVLHLEVLSDSCQLLSSHMNGDPRRLFSTKDTVTHTPRSWGSRWIPAKSFSLKQDFIVVDVRDDDFAGGNIKGAINKPSNGFLTSVDELVKDTKDIPLVIFHCALSQVRLYIIAKYSGPKAARIYEETRKNVLQGNDIPYEVAVLREGFQRFQEKFKDDPALVENWDKDVWESDWS